MEKFLSGYVPVAQLVERLTVNQDVRGSSPLRDVLFLKCWKRGNL